MTEVSSTGWRSFAINSGPLSERINSGAPCSAMAARTKLMTSAEPTRRSGRRT